MSRSRTTSRYVSGSRLTASSRMRTNWRRCSSASGFAPSGTGGIRRRAGTSESCSAVNGTFRRRRVASCSASCRTISRTQAHAGDRPRYPPIPRSTAIQLSCRASCAIGSSPATRRASGRNRAVQHRIHSSWRPSRSGHLTASSRVGNVVRDRRSEGGSAISGADAQSASATWTTTDSDWTFPLTLTQSYARRCTGLAEMQSRRPPTPAPAACAPGGARRSVPAPRSRAKPRRPGQVL